MAEQPPKLTSEQKLIEAIKSWVGESFIGDDCAVLPGRALVTSDSLVEGTHFSLSWTSLADLGWKAVAVNLSDIAAMAGRPRHLVVNLTMPPGFALRQCRELFLSMAGCARAYRSDIVGGDLTCGPLLVLSVTVLGEAHERGCLRRSGAQPGDAVIVSGDFGAGAAGLWALTQEIPGFERVVARHRRPLPRLCESWALVRQTGDRGALMDASDGLADALVQLSRASAVGMRVDLSRVPIHEQTRQAAERAGVDPLDWALYGGEDYELVATVAAADWETMRQSPENPFVAIGTVTHGREVAVEGAAGRQLDLTRSYQHWRELS